MRHERRKVNRAQSSGSLGRHHETNVALVYVVGRKRPTFDLLWFPYRHGPSRNIGIELVRNIYNNNKAEEQIDENEKMTSQMSLKGHLAALPNVQPRVEEAGARRRSRESNDNAKRRLPIASFRLLGDEHSSLRYSDEPPRGLLRGPPATFVVSPRQKAPWDDLTCARSDYVAVLRRATHTRNEGPRP